MIKKAEDIKLKILPVLVGAEHLYYYEGPCRFGAGAELEPGFDTLANEERFAALMSGLEENVPNGVEIMEPVRLIRTDDWDDAEAMWEAIEPAIKQADVAVCAPSIACDDIVAELSERFEIPIAMAPGNRYSPVILSAAISCRPGNREVYAFYKWSDFTYRMKILRARKVVQNLRILCVSRYGSPTSMSAIDSIRDFDAITDRLGVRFHFLNVHELFDQMTPAVEGGNHTTPGRVTLDLTDEDMAEVNVLADELINGAAENDMSREMIVKGLIPYVTVKKNLERWDCNGFTMPCPDACSTRRLNEMQFTPCIIHALNMENGIPSGCEYDIGAVISQQFLIAASGGMRTYMGNSCPVEAEDGHVVLRGGAANAGTELERQRKRLDEGDVENLYLIHHSVAHRYLPEPDKKQPYGIRYFAMDQKFGITMRYDFDADIGKKITLCRISPDGRKLFVGSGEIVLGGGYAANNCSQVVYFRVKNQEDFFKQQCKVGNHLSMVYGDFARELIALGESFGMEVVTA
ncbi:MAG: fucose isomerase [Oscillospiraceae bacterium]|nr:fucose isomerase [Oscillospiraceae bacterium]